MLDISFPPPHVLLSTVSHKPRRLFNESTHLNFEHFYFQVKCAVRARLNANSVPGPFFYSDLFEAGVKVNDCMLNTVVKFNSPFP